MNKKRTRHLFAMILWAYMIPLCCLGQSTDECTFLPLPTRQHASVEQWQNMLLTYVESGRYEYVCIEGNAIDMMYNNQYVMNNAVLSNLLESPGHLKPPHEMPALSEKDYEDLLQYTLECIRTHNSKQDKQIQVVGLSFLDTPLIGFDSRVWHVSKYNQAGLTDSLMTYLADEESDIIQLAELTVKKMDTDNKDMETSLGKLDYFVWKQFFTRNPSCIKRTDPETAKKMRHEDFSRFCKTFKGKKLIIGCQECVH